MQDLYDWIFHQNSDGSGLSLKTMGLLLGLVLIAKHLWAFMQPAKAMALLKQFPRHKGWGIVLLGICMVWTLFLVACMDLGEFYTFRRWLLILVPVTFFLVITFVPEFLAVRALGTLMLLAASPVLHAAFLQPQTSRLLLPILAYAWILAGMFFVGMPYLMRDGAQWASASTGRFKALVLGGAAYGAIMFVAALTTY